MGAQPKANRGPSAAPENRAALLAAARDEFATQGIGAPLSAVAKRAGVGQGTLYRHFPDRVSLALAVFEENMSALEALADQERTTLWDLIDAIIRQAEGAATMIDVVARDVADARVAQFDGRMRAVVTQVLSRSQQSGNPEASVEDVRIAIAMVTLTVSRASQQHRQFIARRARRIIEEGLT